MDGGYVKKYYAQAIIFLLLSSMNVRANLGSIQHSLSNPYGGKGNAPTKIKRETIEIFLDALKQGDVKTVIADLTKTPNLALYRFNLGEKIGNGLTPLSVAVINGQVDVVEAILRLRNDAEQLTANDIAEDTRGNTPFKLAVMNDASNKMLELLLSRGSDINTLNNQHETPLLYAASHGNKRIVKLLLRSTQIDVLQMDKNGKTPLQLAAKNNYTEIVNLLRKAEGNIESLMDILVEYITDQLNA